MQTPPHRARRLFVGGAHTDVGKTFVSSALLRAARAKGASTEAFKPVVSGFDAEDWAESDPGRLLRAQDRDLSLKELEAIAPYRFVASLSPPMAARKEGFDLRLSHLVNACAGVLWRECDFLLIEGAGGIMSPIAEDATCLDLVTRLALPTVVVGGSYLGAISHTLTAVEVLASRGVDLDAIIISESEGLDLPDFAQTVESVARFTTTPVIAAARDDVAWAAALV